MSEQKRKVSNAIQRATRTRASIHGTAERPRLSVHVSNKHMSAQIINDEKHKTLVAYTTVGKKLTGTMTEKAAVVGSEIGKAAKKAKVTKVVFDRNGRIYHGRVKALAEAARKEGLEF